MRAFRTALLVVLCALVLPALTLAADAAEEKEEDRHLDTSTLAGLSLRGIGPALTSGRIIDFAVDPGNPKTYFVATAAGGVWKTHNAGTTWEPIFDGEDSYSIGCVTLDPNNPHTLWVGTGENNSQRSVGYGDGVYRSRDGGKSFEKMGLEASEHIGMIVVDPRDSATVYVAAQGPLWSAGGDRGLYKTTDGGTTWERVLEIDEHTGVSEVILDPRDPDTVYAVAYQRRRHVWTLINGGPGSGLHKSTDAGTTWREINSGLPSGDIGRIGLTLAPANPDVLYAVVEATGDEGGFYRSTDRGESWTRRSDYVSGSPQYYNELWPDPNHVDRVYSADTWLQVTEDGGASFQSVPENYKHVDNHAMWIDPRDSDHLLNGNDGGIYESFDRGQTWRYIANLPITQFYKIEVDNDAPFYHVYGGTQDNFTLGGPARTASLHGITNDDWYITLGGDGFQPRVDPTNPDIIYSQYQNGGLSRFDRASGEILDIRPQPAPGDDPPRWNWDSPLIISPHSPTRLYYGSQRLWRSDDRGESWRPVSDDLTRQIDRNTLEVMGRVWSIDAVAKNRSTSYYGNLVALSESPLIEGLLYVGSDDGAVHVSEDGGESWREAIGFTGVPADTYVNRLEASRHDADTVFAAFNNHKKGDFKPYVMASTDRGRTWQSIASDLPERGSVYALAEDHDKAGLLFAGTEFGVFATLDSGGSWMKLSGGLPTVAVRDLAIQRQESDLVVGTFGRGFYVLDDYSPLRHMSEEGLGAKEATLFPVKDAWMYIENARLGLPGKSFQGDGFYTAPNPPFGAVFTYYLRDGLKSLEDQRKQAAAEIDEDSGNHSYPSWDALRAEAREEEPTLILTITDAAGHVVRRMEGPSSKGLHRVSWDLRYPPSTPARLTPYVPANAFDSPEAGPLAAPGTYTIALAKRIGDETTPIGSPQSFGTQPLGTATLPASDHAALQAFHQKTARLQRAVLGAGAVLSEAQDRIALLKVALRDTASADPALRDRARALELTLDELGEALWSDRVVARRSEPTSPAIVGRVQTIVGGQWTTTSPPTGTNQRNYAIAVEAFVPWLAKLRTAIDDDLAAIEQEAEAAGAPWTPGRVPTFEAE